MRVSASIFLALLLGSTTAVALPGDRNKPINIESDQAERNDKLGTTVYNGNVVIVQGTIKIKGNKVTVYSRGNKVNKIVCIGTPAHYQQIPKPNDKLMVARASTIEYQLAGDKIVLIKNASLAQNGSTITGERINYNLKEEVVRATSNKKTGKRIKMVIPPSNQQGSN